jgi:hypothetical protein
MALISSYLGALMVNKLKVLNRTMRAFTNRVDTGWSTIPWTGLNTAVISENDRTESPYLENRLHTGSVIVIDDV